MYTQPHNRVEDRATLVAFMRDYPFGTLVSSSAEGVPNATHVPFVVEEAGDGQPRLSGHVSKANPQWRDFVNGGAALAIFHGPDAYISPRNYETELAVPTWNYVAVHARGIAQLVDPRKDGMDRLRRLVRAHDVAYEAQMDALPKDWLEAKLKGIAMFEIEVSQLEGRWKLSQDRSPAERGTIATELVTSGNEAARGLGEIMRAASLRAGA